ncbi:MAG: YbgC/FadM family acyl-CoA thioesterase [Chitinivibrionales bacterium]
MKIRIYYEDTDCGNVVYYANYLKYMERSRTEFMRDRGVSFAKLHDEGYLFVVAEARLKYESPAYYDDVLDVTTTIENKSPVSIIFNTAITNSKNVPVVSGTVKVACIQKSDRKLCRIPAEIIERL